VAQIFVSLLWPYEGRCVLRRINHIFLIQLMVFLGNKMPTSDECRKLLVILAAASCKCDQCRADIFSGVVKYNS